MRFCSECQEVAKLFQSPPSARTITSSYLDLVRKSKRIAPDSDCRERGMIASVKCGKIVSGRPVGPSLLPLSSDSSMKTNVS